MAKDAPGMRGIRSRNQNGRLRRKRSDTLVRTIEAKYNVDFGVRSDMELRTLLERDRKGSLNNLLHEE